MPKRKEAEKFAAVGGKDCWHSYGLQTLSPTKFATVVGRILSGNYVLITHKPDQRFSAEA
jgi:hypothetical protein